MKFQLDAIRLLNHIRANKIIPSRSVSADGAKLKSIADVADEFRPIWPGPCCARNPTPARESRLENERAQIERRERKLHLRSGFSILFAPAQHHAQQYLRDGKPFNEVNAN